MPTQNHVMSSHTAQLSGLENTGSTSLATIPIPNEYQKTETMCLQPPAHGEGRVIKVRAIYHYVGNDNGILYSTVEVDLLLDGGRTERTTIRHSEVKDMEGGKAELDNFGSPLIDPVLDKRYIKPQF